MPDDSKHYTPVRPRSETSPVRGRIRRAGHIHRYLPPTGWTWRCACGDWFESRPSRAIYGLGRGGLAALAGVRARLSIPRKSERS